MTSAIMIKDPKAPATGAQLGYLDSLVTQRDLPAVCERYALLKGLGAVTKGQASEWIGELLKAPKKNSQANTVQDWGKAKATLQTVIAVAEEQAPQLTELPAFGYYVQEDGTLLYWDVTGKDQYPTLRRLTIVTNYDGSKKGKWTKVFAGYNGLKVTGTWTPFAGKGYYKDPMTAKVGIPKALIAVVTGGIAPLEQGEAAQLSKKFGFCIRCGATLTDPVSVAQGLGPICVKYWGV